MRQIKFRQWHGNQFTYWGTDIEYPSTFTGPSTIDGQKATNRISNSPASRTKTARKSMREILSSYGVYKQLVEWREFTGADGELVAGYDFASSSASSFEVVGNIHENPDLLSL
jgi:hypothetical protein